MKIFGFMKVFTHMSYNDTHIHNIFSIPIWGFLLKNHEYEKNDYIDYLYNLKEMTKGVRKSNFLNSWHSDTDLFNQGIFRELSDSILDIATNIATGLVKDPKLNIHESWANINAKYSYNAHHVHAGLLSGVFYLKTPKDSGRLILSNPAVRSQSHLIRPKDFPCEPEPLSLIIFPTWLEHYVEPNKSEEDRISISFNIGLEYGDGKLQPYERGK